MITLSGFHCRLCLFLQLFSRGHGQKPWPGTDVDRGRVDSPQASGPALRVRQDRSQTYRRRHVPARPLRAEAEESSQRSSRGVCQFCWYVVFLQV